MPTLRFLCALATTFLFIRKSKKKKYFSTSAVSTLKPESRTAIQKVDFLMAQANHEDGILQAYRSLILTVHSIVLAGAAALTGAAFQVLKESEHLSLLSVAVCVSAIFSGLALRGAEIMLEIKQREVAYYHRLLIEAESHLNEEDKIFTTYKRFQEHNYTQESADQFDPKLSGGPIDPRKRIPFIFSRHTGKGQSKRRAIGWQFKLIVGTWLVLLTCTILAPYFVNRTEIEELLSNGSLQYLLQISQDRDKD